MSKILFSHFENNTFYFRCFAQYSSFATLSYNTRNGDCCVHKDDPYDNSNALPLQKIVSAWVKQMKPYITEVVAAAICILEQSDDRLLAQIINHSLKHPDWYTEDYWRSIPTLLTISKTFDELQAQPSAHADETPLILS